MNGQDRLTIVDELAISISAAVGTIGARNTVGKHEYGVLLTITHGPNGVVVDSVDVASPTEGHGTLRRPTSRGISDEEVCPLCLK